MPGLFDKIEQKRQEFNAMREKKGIGTLKGFALAIEKKRAMAAIKAKDKATGKEQSDAK